VCGSLVERERSRQLAVGVDLTLDGREVAFDISHGVPHDRVLSDLVGELSTHSRQFATLWASHDVREHRTGTKRFTHPAVGELELAYEAMDLASARGLQLIAYSAQPGSASEDGLWLLTSWAATTTDSRAHILPTLE